jgi:Xaa-Pro aminopeptidase
LTVDQVKTELEMELLRHRCVLQEVIVSCGEDAAEPHNLGEGPLKAGETIVVDIFPQHKESKYFGDMSRTFVKGAPSDDVREFYELSMEAMEAALDQIEAGVSGEELFNTACDVFEEAGYPTFRSDESTKTGFISSLGHGVGLEIHEEPHLAPTGEELEAGHVVTVEPGLYDPDVGGVRIEDMVVVTEGGFRNLNEYHKDLVIE